MNNLNYTANLNTSLNQGTWDAENNVPDLTLVDVSDTSKDGHFWTVGTSGITDISSLGLGDISEVEQGDEMMILDGAWTLQEGGISEAMLDTKISNVFNGLSYGDVPMKGTGDTLIPSSIDDEGESTTFSKSISVPPSSIDIGYDVTVSDSGGLMIYTTNSLGLKRICVTNDFDDDGSVHQPYTTIFNARETVAWQEIDEDTLTSDSFEFTRTTTAHELIFCGTFKLGATRPTDNVTVSMYRNGELLSNNVVTPTDIDSTGVFTVDFQPSVTFYKDEPVDFEITSDSEFDLLGDADSDVPYMHVDRQTGEIIDLATVNDLPVKAYGIGRTTSDYDLDMDNADYHYTIKAPLTLGVASNVELGKGGATWYDNGLSPTVDGDYKITVSVTWSMDDDSRETFIISLWKESDGTETLISEPLLQWFYNDTVTATTTGIEVASLSAGDVIYLKAQCESDRADLEIKELKILLEKL